MPALNSGHTVSKISHPQLVRSFCHELTVYAVACGNGFPADGRTDLFTPENTGKSHNGLASKVQNVLKDDPFSGHLFIFRGRRGDQIKVLWADSDGLCLFTKRLERGRFVWPVTRDGKVHLTPAQLSMLLEGINWKHPKRTERAGIRI